jgi:sugar lactone lactonase YvrE
LNVCLRRTCISLVFVFFIPVFFTLLLLTVPVFAEGTLTWEQSKFDELSKGTAQGVAIRSSGGLELAPAFKALATTPSAYIWAIASDPQGNLYAAAGGPARVYRITPDGKSTTIFEPQELQVQALAVGKGGVIYAATNPDGKVYKLERKPAGKGGEKASDAGSWSSSVYFNPDTKYIWDLLLDQAGNLYVATGDRGEIFRVTPKGEHSVFFTSDEPHIRVLALDSKGNVIAGSDGSGLVYRISPDGKAFVLYSAPKKEITALALDKEGNIYASGVGEKRAAKPSPILTITPQPAPTPSLPTTQTPGIAKPNVPPSAPIVIGNFPAPGASAAGGSEIYRISPDGSPTQIWSSREDLVYALAFDPRGRLLAGTGNRGHIFGISGQDEYSDLLKASASQVTAFAKAPGGGLYAATSNLGKVFLLGAAPESEGSYESDVFDANIFSRWGRAEFRGRGNVQLFARSGNVDNPDRNWSPWQSIDLRQGAEIGSPPARFVQWKAVLRAGDPPPEVDSVTLNYLPKNVAPEFDSVTVQVGVHYQALPKQPVIENNAAKAARPKGRPHIEMPVPTVQDSGSIGVKWAVHDDNDDSMVYSIYYRGDGESRWLLLKDDLTDKFYSFDASLLPDGGYTVKVVASDAPSHSPGEALTSERESTRFEVDTTPPQIADLHATVEGAKIHVTFRAVDSFSPIDHAEYSIDASDWQYVDPVGQLSDSKTENYDFLAPAPSDPNSAKSDAAGIEHVVVVRAYDRYDNMSSAKTIIPAK